MFTFLHLASVDGQLAGGGDGAQVVVEALDRGRPLGRGLFLLRRRAQNVSWQQKKELRRITIKWENISHLKY